jgi:hypothetical protein
VPVPELGGRGHSCPELSVCIDQEPNFSLGEIRVRVRKRGQELADRSIMTINSNVPVVMWIEPGLSC